MLRGALDADTGSNPGADPQDFRHSVPCLVFGAKKRKIDDDAMKVAQRRPGFVLKFMISDDEIAFFSLLRVMRAAGEDKACEKIIEKVIDTAKQFLDAAHLPGGTLLLWGKGYIELLEAATKTRPPRRRYGTGLLILATFDEERRLRATETSSDYPAGLPPPLRQRDRVTTVPFRNNGLPAKCRSGGGSYKLAISETPQTIQTHSSRTPTVIYFNLRHMAICAPPCGRRRSTSPSSPYPWPCRRSAWR